VSGRHHRLLAHIIEPLLPSEPPLAREVREAVREAVVGFVGAQIAGMPAHFRLPYRVAMVGFNWLAVRQYGRRFVNLDAAKQADYVSVWIHSTLGVKRDFIKLIRSCALLRFYDHPAVLAAMEEWGGGQGAGGGDRLTTG